MSDSDILALKKKIEALSPANQLRLAAAFIEHQRYDLAEILTRNVADELYALQVLHHTSTP